MKFYLKNSGGDLGIDVYEYVNPNEREKIIIFHYKDNNTVKFVGEEFILRDEGMYVPMMAEKDNFIKHSCKYGHWELINVPVTEEMLEHALELVKLHRMKSTWRNNAKED